MLLLFIFMIGFQWSASADVRSGTQLKFELTPAKERMLEALARSSPVIDGNSGVEMNRLPPHTEVFVTQKFDLGNGNFVFYGEVHTGELDGTKVWVPFNSQAPQAKLLTSEQKDKLAFSTADINEVTYLFTTEPVTAIRDDQWWVETIDSLNPTDYKCVMDKKFVDLEERVTATGRYIEPKATDTDQPCPKNPQTKDGSKCKKRSKKKLNSKLKEYVKSSAERYGVDPGMLAAMIQMESEWDPFIDNGGEKKRCLKESADGNCSDYKWSRGLGQFGKNVAEEYGLDWTNANGEFKPPAECASKKKFQPPNIQCTQALENLCQPYISRGELVPIYCPQAMIEATAKHLKDAFPEELLMWVKNESGQLEMKDIIPAVTANEGDAIRAQISYFQRGVRVFNSYVEHYDQNGRWPDSYGEAWVTPRLKSGTNESPSIDIGYQMLTNEFVNRCHIWALVGLCGEVPEWSLVGQYRNDF